jgi:hypothetical protein
VTNTVRPKPPNAGKGRPKGAKNKTTTALKDSILLAAKSAGSDGKGKGGLGGYLKRLAIHEPKTFGGLLGRVLPLQVVGDPNAPLELRVLQVTSPAEQAAAWQKP